MDFFDDISNRIRPLVPAFLKAEAKRWSQLKALGSDDPMRAEAEKEFQQTLRSTFEGDQSLTPFHRTLIAGMLESPPVFFEQYRIYYEKEKSRGNRPWDDIVIHLNDDG